MIPENSIPIENKAGTAPGIYENIIQEKNNKIYKC